jgi:hypothetical protein
MNYKETEPQLSAFFKTLLDMGGGGLIGPPFFQRPNTQKNLKSKKSAKIIYPSS